MLEATSLGETKEQIAKLEEKLTSLKEEKHQLFLTLKKVLNEDETRRRKETSEMNILYPQHGAMANFPLSGHVAQNNVAMYLHPQSRQPAMYLKPHSLPAGQLPPQAIKRQRTPSPPRTAAHYRGSGRTGTSSVYGHPAASGAPIYSSSSYHFPGGAGPARDEERKQPGQPVYLAHSSHQARYAGSLHPAGSSKTGPGLGERARLAAAAAPPPAAHAQLSSSSRGYPAGASLPPRLAYTQAAQLVAAQQVSILLIAVSYCETNYSTESLTVYLLISWRRSRQRPRRQRADRPPRGSTRDHCTAGRCEHWCSGWRAGLYLLMYNYISYNIQSIITLHIIYICSL